MKWPQGLVAYYGMTTGTGFLLWNDHMGWLPIMEWPQGLVAFYGMTRGNNLMSLSFVKIEDFNKITRFQIANSWLVLPNFCCTFHPSSSWKSQRLPEPFGSYTFCVLCSIPVIHLSLAVVGSVVSISASETVELKKGNTSSSLKPFACNVPSC